MNLTRYEVLTPRSLGGVPFQNLSRERPARALINQELMVEGAHSGRVGKPLEVEGVVQYAVLLEAVETPTVTAKAALVRTFKTLGVYRTAVSHL